MEVDEIVIHDDNDNDLKSSDNDLCPIANDPYKSTEPKHFDKGMTQQDCQLVIIIIFV